RAVVIAPQRGYTDRRRCGPIRPGKGGPGPGRLPSERKKQPPPTCDRARSPPCEADPGGLACRSHLPLAVGLGGKCKHSEVTPAQALGGQFHGFSMARNLLLRSLP